MSDRRNGSDTWSKPSALRGRGIIQNVDLGRCRKLCQHGGKNNTVEEEPEGWHC